MLFRGFRDWSRELCRNPQTSSALKQADLLLLLDRSVGGTLLTNAIGDASGTAWRAFLESTLLLGK